MKTGAQVNALFAGVILDASIADPTFLGSRWDAGADLFALAIEGSDTVFVGDIEDVGSEVKVRPASLDLALGHPMGAFAKIDLRYSATSLNYSEGDNTDPDFALPSDHIVQTAGLVLRYNRAGYRFRAGGSYNDRSQWEPWGYDGNPDYSPENQQFRLWNAGLSKIWHLRSFRKLGVEVAYVGGDHLDRFSKYDFGLFSDLRVHGYQSGKIKAESAYSTHLTYGFGLGEIFRIDLVGDFAWATDEASGLDNELLAGFGVVGTVTGPWSTIINMDIGIAAAGPDDGIGVLLTVLKLFGGV